MIVIPLTRENAVSEKKKKLAFVVKAPENLQEAGFVIMALAGAVSTLVKELAKHHDGKPGPWLDEIEEVLIRDAKGTVAADIHIATEASGMKKGIDLLDALIKNERSILIKKAE